MSLTGSISEWNGERGYGYIVCDGRRIFLHIRDFKERHRQPEVGDAINFVMGTDKQGRPCAKEVVQVNAYGRIKAVHFLILLFLVLPGVALYSVLGSTGLSYAGSWVALISGLTYFIYAVDKHQAQAGGWREAEYQLHLLELFGGWPGAFLAQRRLRHKSSKGTYQFVFVLIIGLHQLVALDALRGWPFIRVIAQVIQKLF